MVWRAGKHDARSQRAARRKAPPIDRLNRSDGGGRDFIINAPHHLRAPPSQGGPYACCKIKEERLQQRQPRRRTPPTPARSSTTTPLCARAKKSCSRSRPPSEGELRLGEIADQLKTHYDDRTIAKFAKAIDVAKCTVDRYRTVYRAWKMLWAAARILHPSLLM